ncbi:hypothetical protein FB446DRAFT_771554 [Lentinula raphanica]|nr:hypothetical protein FB446DRAFT_771554 [Lentinula raphanica]
MSKTFQFSTRASGSGDAKYIDYDSPLYHNRNGFSASDSPYWQEIHSHTSSTSAQETLIQPSWNHDIQLPPTNAIPSPRPMIFMNSSYSPIIKLLTREVNFTRWAPQVKLEPQVNDIGTITINEEPITDDPSSPASLGLSSLMKQKVGSLKLKQQANNHENSHEGKKPYACPYCIRRFTGARAKNRHVKICKEKVIL